MKITAEPNAAAPLRRKLAPEVASSSFFASWSIFLRFLSLYFVPSLLLTVLGSFSPWFFSELAFSVCCFVIANTFVSSFKNLTSSFSGLASSSGGESSYGGGLACLTCTFGFIPPFLTQRASSSPVFQSYHAPSYVFGSPFSNQIRVGVPLIPNLLLKAYSVVTLITPNGIGGCSNLNF